MRGVWGWVRGGVAVGVEGGARRAVTWAKSKAKTTAPRFPRDAAGKPLRCRTTSSRILCGTLGSQTGWGRGRGASEAALRVVPGRKLGEGVFWMRFGLGGQEHGCGGPAVSPAALRVSAPGGWAIGGAGETDRYSSGVQDCVCV